MFLFFQNTASKGYVLFLVAKKSTKRRRLKGTFRKGMSPLESPAPPRQPAFKNVPIFERLRLKNFQFFLRVDAGKSEHFPVSGGDAAQGFLKGTCLFGMSP